MPVVRTPNPLGKRSQVRSRRWFDIVGQNEETLELYDGPSYSRIGSRFYHGKAGFQPMR
jgi:hypothetical protein